MSNRRKKREDRLYQTLRNNRRKRFQDKAAEALRAMHSRQVDAMVDDVEVKES